MGVYRRSRAAGTGRCGRSAAGAARGPLHATAGDATSPSRRVRCLGGNQHVVTSAAQRLTEYLLGRAVGIHVCGVDEVDARFEGEVDQPTCMFDVGIAPSSEELTSLPANVAVPRLNSDTSRPELPTRRYSMIPP